MSHGTPSPTHSLCPQIRRRTYRFGLDFTVKVRETAPGSGVAILEYATQKGEEPPDHTHQTEDEYSP